jgi:hypothetical protein
MRKTAFTDNFNITTQSDRFIETKISDNTEASQISQEITRNTEMWIAFFNGDCYDARF